MPLPKEAHETCYDLFTIDELVTAAQSGHSAAFNEIMRRYSGLVYRTAHKILRNRVDADDVVQDAFMNVLKHLPKFRRDAAFATWLTRIAINTSLMYLRRHKRNRLVGVDSYDEMEPSLLGVHWMVGPTPEKNLMEIERRQRLLVAVSALPECLREITVERIATDATIAELAQKKGITISAAKSRLLRARITLAEQFNLSA